MVYDIDRNKGGCSHGYNSGHKFGFNISCGFSTNYSYSPFQDTDNLYSKPIFKFTLGSVFYRL